MIYFYIEPEGVTIKRFKSGREILSLQEPPLVLVSPDRQGKWRAIAAGKDVKTSQQKVSTGDFVCNPFLNRELIVEEPDIAAQYVNYMIFHRILNPFTTLIRPQLILHPHIQPEKPLAPVEKHNLQQIGILAGAREVYICEWPTMLTAQIMSELRPIPQNQIKTNKPKSAVE